MQKSKTDNHDLGAKLALRKWFLTKYHSTGDADVLDCCMGEGTIWNEIRRDHLVRSYLGLDLKPKKGRLRLDSRRYLERPGWEHNCIDIDTYGSPWSHWFHALRNGKQTLTIFLTVGQRVTGTVGSLSNDALRALGLHSLRRVLPKGFHPKLTARSVDCCLGACITFGWQCVDCMEVHTDNRNVRYIGVRIEKTSELPSM